MQEAHPPCPSGSTPDSGPLLPHADVRWQPVAVDGPGQVAPGRGDLVASFGDHTLTVTTAQAALPTPA